MEFLLSGLFWGWFFSFLYYRGKIKKKAKEMSSTIVNEYKIKFSEVIKKMEEWNSERTKLEVENQLLELRIKNKKLKLEVVENEEKEKD